MSRSGDEESPSAHNDESGRGAADPPNAGGTDALLYRWALECAAVAGAAIAPPLGLVVVGLLFVVVGLSWAVIAVTAAGLVTELAPESVRAEALGAYTAAGSLGGGIGSAVGGGVADGVGYLPAFVVAGGVVIAACLAVDGVRRGVAA